MRNIKRVSNIELKSEGLTSSKVHLKIGGVDTSEWIIQDIDFSFGVGRMNTCSIRMFPTAQMIKTEAILDILPNLQHNSDGELLCFCPKCAKKHKIDLMLN